MSVAKEKAACDLAVQDLRGMQYKVRAILTDLYDSAPGYAGEVEAVKEAIVNAIHVLSGTEGPAGVKYVVQYRSRTLRGARRIQGTEWKDAQTFDTLDEANRVRDDAVRYEARGTKDWRVRPAK